MKLYGQVAIGCFVTSIVLNILGVWSEGLKVPAYFILGLGWVIFFIGLLLERRAKKEKDPLTDDSGFRYIGDDPENRELDY